MLTKIYLTITLGLLLAGGALADDRSLPHQDVSPSLNGQSAAVEIQSPSTLGISVGLQAISAAGGQGSSTSYNLGCTLAQIVVGSGSSDSYETWPGIWPSVPAGSGCGLPGDANGDATVNVGDAVYIINYVFKGGAPPPNLNEGDANGDCGVNVGDAVYLINYIFKGGPEPVCGCAEI